ncbi:Mov34/MPN/PAD-1 family protein, partial [Oscillatoriales cyanobacterium LEGE 11467]
MTINLQNQHLQLIRTHAERAYPNECCGLILGRSGMGGSGKSEKESIKVWETKNTWSEDSPGTRQFDRESKNPLTQERRYTIAPEEMLAAQRHARDLHL